MKIITDEERKKLIADAVRASATAREFTALCLRTADEAEAAIQRSRLIASARPVMDQLRASVEYEDQDDPKAHHGHSRRPISATIIPFPAWRVRRV